MLSAAPCSSQNALVLTFAGVGHREMPTCLRSDIVEDFAPRYSLASPLDDARHRWSAVVKALLIMFQRGGAFFAGP